MEIVHVIPLNDLVPHVCDEECPCLPRTEKAGAGIVVIHNAWDLREIEELNEDLHSKYIQ